MKQIILVAHNIRSTHNIGSLLRTADGLGINKVYLTGYSPYPTLKNDKRMPHLAKKINAQISKTALGAEKSVAIEQSDNIMSVIKQLHIGGFEVCALELDSKATNLPDYKPINNVAIIVGREVEGIEPEVLKVADKILQIPMFGKKESFNVSVAAAIALYHLRFN